MTLRLARGYIRSVPPSLVLGAMNFGKRTSERESIRIVERALERNICAFDTANAYNDGESERILGNALRERRAECTIATKVGFGRVNGRSEGLSRERVLSALDASLARLGTSYVDIYYLHVPDPLTPIEETLDGLHELLRSERIRSWGVSNYASWQILEMMRLADERNMARPSISQQIYNLLIRQLDVEYFAFARRYPIGTTVYNPLAGGLLTGKHTSTTESQRGSRFENNRLYQGRYWSEPMFAHVNALKEIAREAGLSLVELAYGWLAQRNGIQSILVGPASVEHLDAAIDASQAILSAETCAKIDALYRRVQGTETHYAR